MAIATRAAIKSGVSHAHIVYRLLATTDHPAEREDLLQLVYAGRERVDQVQSLRQQAEKAERLAKSGFDALTCERLLAASREYRQRAFEFAGTIHPVRRIAHWPNFVAKLGIHDKD